MRLSGELFWSTGIESTVKVKQAVITSKRISIDWPEGNRIGHLEATSRDGEHFSGHYGYDKPDPNFEFDLTLFRNKSEIVLLGTWCEHDSGYEGKWLFRLSAEQANAPKGKRRAKS